MNTSPQPRNDRAVGWGGFCLILGKPLERRYPATHFSLADPLVKGFVCGFAAAATLFVAAFAGVYVHFARVIESRMNGPVFANAPRIYARALLARVGDEIDEQTLLAHLRRAGYTEAQQNDVSPIGTIRLLGDGVEVAPGPESAGQTGPFVVHFSGDRIEGISALSGGTGHRDMVELEPPLITALSEGQNRSKRQLVTFDQIPKDLVNAVVAIEDRRFFSHSGVNFFRLFQAAVTDILHLRRKQGGSTITMQLARGFFLSPEKTLRRKTAEAFIAVEIEQRYSKQKIFEMYANQVPMGHRGTFSISGFGEASRIYFDKDITKLTLPEAALVAGILQRPSHLSPFRYPERAMRRRNLVLDSMVETGAISQSQAGQAKSTPLNLAGEKIAEGEAPYFADMLRDQLSRSYSESDLNTAGLRVYTTLDLDLQRAALEAVAQGMKSVDEQLAKQRARASKSSASKNHEGVRDALEQNDHRPPPQVALVALDPHSGEVLALVGGRNYDSSQLNHVLAKRPTGSIFKPFVYAAAINTALSGRTFAPNPDDPESRGTPTLFTPMTRVDDSQVSIAYAGETYEPRNYHSTFHGFVSARYALAQSLNNATVKIAQMVGFGTVASLAKSAGISSVHATPSIALGAYDATPLDMVGAYTVFANQGVRVAPRLMTSLRSADGKRLGEYHSETKTVLDPRVAYVLTDMMAGVLDSGTGYSVRTHGFNLPAAGKTGTSHDAWFAGYTPNLLCVIWIGNDDYSDLEMSGGATAAPIWAEFMKTASSLPRYAKTKYFPQPAGVSQVQIDRNTGKVATPDCPEHYTIAFISGTEPPETCSGVGDHGAPGNQ